MADEAPANARERGPSVGRASLQIMGGRIGANGGYFVSVLILARALGPAERGTFAFITTTMLVTAVLAGSGLREGFTVFLAQRPEARARLATNLVLACIASGVAGGAIILVALGPFPSLRPSGVDLETVAIMAVGILVLSVAYGGFSLGLGLHQFRVQAIAQPLTVWAYTAAIAVLWLASALTIHRAAILWIVSQAGGAVPLYVNGLRVSGLGRASGELMRETWRYGVRAWVGSVSTYLGFRSDQVLMAFISTQSQLGIYAVAVNASEVPLYVPQSVSVTLTPIVAAGPSEERRERTLRVYRLVTVTTTAVAAAAAAVGPFLIPLAFGRSFSGSVEPFLWLLPGAVFFVASSIFSAALAAAAAPGLSSAGPFATLVVGIVLDLVLIPPFGATGAAIAASGGFLAGGIAAFAAFRRIEPIRARDLVPRRSDVATVVDLLRRRGA